MRYLITGGAGFIGINFADKLLQRGEQVIILDNFSKVGSRINLKWLTGKYKKNFQVIKADIGKDRLILNRQVKKVDVVFHLAAQTAVTTSVKDPQRDFQTNVIGTFNLLESIRVNRPKTVLILRSTRPGSGF
ncbi:MAG: GDP-mannose 4,6-dehydratase [Candidatus Microgenomates bacterium]